jgi:uncharacterized damage-inducible protein DinB
MELHALIAELFSRIDAHVHEVVDGLDAEMLTTPPQLGANTIGWLVWHLTRVQDHHIASLLEQEQVWGSDGWAERFGVAPASDNTGYGHSADEVAAIRPENGAALVEYYEAVAARTNTFIATLTPDDLDRVVDERWDPPVTLGVRLMSIADDDIQHAGQAAYARGMLTTR